MTISKFVIAAAVAERVQPIIPLRREMQHAKLVTPLYALSDLLGGVV